MSAATLERLARWRARGTRASEQIVKDGTAVLEKGGLRKMGDEAWSLLEQLTLASLDIGRLDIADECLDQLTEEFPRSPRVECLKGLRLEADNKLLEAYNFYEAALQEDDTNAALWKRQIAVLRSLGPQGILNAVDKLTKYLDTFYTDIEAWIELADIYASLNLYAFSLQALSHVLILASQNPWHVLHFAETAYTAKDIPLALKMFLRVIDMDEPSSPESKASKRAWWGVKLTASKLLSLPNLQSESKTQPPSTDHLKLLDELATEHLAESYRSTSAADTIQGRNAILTWLGGPKQ